MCEPPFNNLYRLKNEAMNTHRVSMNMDAKFDANSNIIENDELNNILHSVMLS